MIVRFNLEDKTIIISEPANKETLWSAAKDEWASNPEARKYPLPFIKYDEPDFALKTGWGWSIVFI